MGALLLGFVLGAAFGFYFAVFLATESERTAVKTKHIVIDKKLYKLTEVDPDDPQWR